MWKLPRDEQYVDELFLAGEMVPPGVYKQIGGDRVVNLDTEDWLPASLDGRTAVYMRVISKVFSD